MPRLIDYPLVLEQMTARGFVSLYPSSGAFGFPPEAGAGAVGWIGGEDPTIRPAARELAIAVAPPVEPNLAALTVRAWREHLHGPIWLMPKAHWAYELMFGSQGWLAALLDQAGLPADVLHARHDGTAAEFEPDESAALLPLLEGLLTHLLGSDFLLAWPAHPVVCTVHHHKQIWWTTTDASLVAILQRLPAI